MMRWSNSYFVRLLLSYCVLAVLLIGIAGGYLYNRANAVMVEEMTRDSQHTLNKIKDYLEGTLLRKYEDTFVTKVMTTVNPNSTDDLTVLLENTAADHMYEIANLINDMGNIASANEGLAGITIYFKQAEYVIDEMYFYQAPVNSPDYAFIQSLNDTAPYQWIKRTKGGTGEPVLTYVYTLPYKFLHPYTQGYLYIDISLDYLMNMMNNLTSSSQEKLLMFDKEGNLIFQNQPVDAAAMKLIYGIVGEQRTGFSATKDRAGSSMVAYLPNPDSNGWGYVVIKPMNSFFLMTEKLKSDIIWICASILSIGLLSAYIVSNRLYLPLKRLVLRMGDHYGNHAQIHRVNEYKVIDSYMQYTDKKLVQLQDRVRDKNLLDLINGNISAIDDLAGVPDYSLYVPVHVKIKEGTGHSLHRVFAEPPQSHSIDFVNINAHEAVLLFYSNRPEQETAHDIYEEMHRYVSRCPEDLQIVAAIGDAAHALDHIHQSHSNAEYACSYGFLYGYPAIILYEEIRHRRPAHIPFPFEPYFNGLLAGDRHTVETIIGKYALELSDANMMVQSLEVNVMQFVTSLSGFMIDHDLQHIVPAAKLFSDAIKPTLEETVQWMKEISVQIAAHYAGRASSSHTKVIQQLKRYIDDHSDEDISLDSLAERAGLSPNYVSALFKEAVHLPVIEYIHKIRLEKAAALLQETNATVNEISVQVGYRYTQYFCRKFKEKYGVTPLQFRQTWTGERNTSAPTFL